MLIWTDDQAVAEKARGPSLAGLEVLRALRALRHAEAALIEPLQSGDVPALANAVDWAREAVTAAVVLFEADEAQVAALDHSAGH